MDIVDGFLQQTHSRVMIVEGWYNELHKVGYLLDIQNIGHSNDKWPLLNKGGWVKRSPKYFLNKITSEKKIPVNSNI